MNKAILVVSFGTTHEDTRKVTIDKIEERIRNEFKEYEIRRAFTAHKIIKVLENRDGIKVDTPEEALEKLYKEGFDDVIVQPLHIIPGEEYDYIKLVVENFKDKQYFKKIRLGRPALYFKGIDEEIPDDYSIFVHSVKKLIKDNMVTVFMGHGSVHYSNACYCCLENVFKDNDFNNVYIGNVEGYPSIHDVIRKLKNNNVKEVTLMPLMLVAGDHAKNDMVGEDDDSWKNLILNEGIKVNEYVHGLGEITEFQDIYLKHINDVIDNKYMNLGKTKKGLK